MANVTEGLTRVAAAIATGRSQRRELAMELENVMRRRRSEVRSLLASLKSRRGGAHREQRARAEKAVRVRHGEIHSLLEEMKASRGKAARERRNEAIAANSGRRREVRTLLARFSRERIAQMRHRRAVAAAFMRDLTHGVASLRANFVKMGRDRAAALHARLGAYALDRQEAAAMWRGTHRQGRQAVSAHSSAPRHEGSHDVGAPHGKRVGGSSHRGPNERHGGDMK